MDECQLVLRLISSLHRISISAYSHTGELERTDSNNIFTNHLLRPYKLYKAGYFFNYRFIQWLAK